MCAEWLFIKLPGDVSAAAPTSLPLPAAAADIRCSGACATLTALQAAAYAWNATQSAAPRILRELGASGA